ncbi:MAG: TetR/AcrR family transcriptional regulator [Spirochaetales bacterium]|nr:TetR/AcrR family transcriptional regulator [Spirochaetales bacterium]
MKDAEATKQKIIDCAVKLFAEEGFDGARVDKLAEMAGVNKALIYYYFKSKEAVLEMIFKNFIEKANGILIELAMKNISFDSPEAGEYMGRYNQFLMDNPDILKIMMIESIKGKTKIPPIFKLIDFSGPEGVNEEEVIKNMQGRGFNLKSERNFRLIIEFFTGIIPELCFSLFKKQWSHYFKLSEEDALSLFHKAQELTHVAHYKKKE